MQQRVGHIWLIILFWASGTIFAQGPEALRIGEISQISISDGEAQVSMTYEGQAEARISLSAFSMPGEDLIGGTLRLFGPDGSLLSSAYTESYGSALIITSLPQTGRYTIAFERESWETRSGRVNILLGAVTATQELGLQDLEEVEFEYPGRVFEYSFEGQASQVLRYGALCNTCALLLYGPDGVLWLADGYYESPGQRIALMPALSGTYRLILHAGLQAGPATLSFDAQEPPLIQPGEPMTGELLSGGSVVVAFESTAGKTWQLDAELSEGFSAMTLLLLEGREPWNTVLDGDNGSGPGGAPRISNFTAPVNGTYYVHLLYESYISSNSVATYALSLRPSSQLQLAPGVPVTSSVSVESGSQTYIFEGLAGQRVRLTIERQSETGGLGLLVSSAEDELINMVGRSADRNVVDLLLPLDGSYRVTVSNVDYLPSTLDFSMTLETLPE